MTAAVFGTAQTCHEQDPTIQSLQTHPLQTTQQNSGNTSINNVMHAIFHTTLLHTSDSNLHVVLTERKTLLQPSMAPTIFSIDLQALEALIKNVKEICRIELKKMLYVLSQEAHTERELYMHKDFQKLTHAYAIEKRDGMLSLLKDLINEHPNNHLLKNFKDFAERLFFSCDTIIGGLADERIQVHELSKSILLTGNIAFVGSVFLHSRGLSMRESEKFAQAFVEALVVHTFIYLEISKPWEHCRTAYITLQPKAAKLVDFTIPHMNIPQERIQKLAELSNALQNISNALKDHQPLIAILHVCALEHQDNGSARPLFDYANRLFSGTEHEKTMREFAQYFNSPETRWLDRAIEEAPLHLVKDALGASSPILKRFTQIVQGASSEEFENAAYRMQEKDMMKLAFFIEEKVKPVQTCAQKYFTAAKDHCPRDVHFDSETHEVYIIANPESSKLQAHGTYKRALSAFLLPFENRDASAIEHVVQLSPKKFLQKAAPSAEPPIVNLTDIEREIAFYKAFVNTDWVAQLRSVTNLTTFFFTNSPPQKSLSLIVNKADQGTLLTVFTKRATVETQIQLAKKLIHAVAAMHKRGVFHGDLKASNVLLNKKGDLLLSDFGFSFFLNDSNDIKSIWPIQVNRYAAWWYTPPELFKRELHQSYDKDPSITKEDYKKIESWAVGCMLYHLSFKMPQWIRTLMHQIFVDNDSIPVLTKEEHKEMKEEHALLIEGQRQRMMDDPSLLCKPSRHYSFTIYNLLRYDPALRWSLEQAEAYLQQHVVLPEST